MIEQKVTELLTQLSSKLGIASEKIWEWSLLQVKVQIIQSIAWALLMALVTYAFIKAAKWVSVNWDELYQKDNEVYAVAGLALSGALVLIGDIGAMLDLYNLPQLFINPEFSAFEIIINQLSQLK